jgi:hypothetical protein
LLASAAPSDKVLSFAQAICGCTRPPSPQSIEAMTVSGLTASAKRMLDRDFRREIAKRSMACGTTRCPTSKSWRLSKGV